GPQPLAGEVRQPGELRFEPARVADVHREGVLRAQGLLLEVGLHRTVVDAGGALAHPRRIAAEEWPENLIARRPQLAQGPQPRGLHFFAELAPEPRQAPYRQRIEHPADEL